MVALDKTTEQSYSLIFGLMIIFLMNLKKKYTNK